MGRYDQAKSKKSGRYNQNRNKKSGGVNASMVILLVILAGAGGFYFAARLPNGVTLSEIKALLVPFDFDKADTVEPDAEKTDADEIAPEAESIVDEKDTAIDIESPTENLEELQLQEPVILPVLDSSDEPLREQVTKLSPGLLQWLNTDNLISKYLVIVNDFSQGLRIDNHMRFLKPDQPFTADQNDQRTVIATKSYQRYNKLAAAIDAMDVPATLAVYKKFKPLLMQVFTEFSYPEDTGLEDIFIKAAAEILAAPVIEEPIALIKPSIRYKFADPRLEALNPVHKQMIRMGPENTRIIQSKVRMLVEELANLKE